MIKLLNGRLTQWDTGRLVEVSANQGETIDEIHCYFADEVESYRVEPRAEGGTTLAQIPNILLQENRAITVSVVTVTEDGRRTVESTTFHVFASAKPSNYVYTESEVLTIERVIEDALQKAKDSGEFKGDKGDPGENYTLTDADKVDIAVIALTLLPDAEEVSY